MKANYSILNLKFLVTLFSLIYSFSTKQLCTDPTQYLQFVKGYETSIHKTVSKDGYHLTLFRSLPAKPHLPVSSNSFLKTDHKPKGKLFI